MKKYRRKLFVTNRLLILAVILIGSYTGYHTIKTSVSISNAQRSVDALKIQIEETEQANKEILETIENGTTDEVIAAIARERLDLVIPGERIIVDASGN